MSETIKFNPTASPRKENIYLEEYYSGADCNVYIDGKLHENIAGINFQIQEQLKPLYGYASRVFDDVAVGNRIVTGTIQIPIVNPSATNLDIDDDDKHLDLTVSEISSVETDSNVSSPNVNNFVIKPIPDWVRDWITEYGYDLSTDGTTPSGEPSFNPNEIFTSVTLQTQQKLLSLGYNVSTNGIEDAKTEKALLQYQTLNGLNLTGIIDTETYNHMFNIDAYQGKPTVITQETLPVRIGPSLIYPIFYNLAPGSSITCLSNHGDFSKIVIPDGREGYALKSVIDPWIMI